MNLNLSQISIFFLVAMNEIIFLLFCRFTIAQNFQFERVIVASSIEYGKILVFAKKSICYHLRLKKKSLVSRKWNQFRQQKEERI